MGSLVTINIEMRSRATWSFVVKHSANPKLDNCFRDYAQRNAKELADLLKQA